MRIKEAMKWREGESANRRMKGCFATSSFRPLAISLLLTLAVPAQAAPKLGNDFTRALGGNTIQVEINKGAPIHLSAPAASVAIADPTVADIQVISPKLVMVTGRGVGETSILATDAADTIILQSTVSVSHNLSKLQAAINEVTPMGSIHATSEGGAIVLRGKADSPTTSETVQRLASGFLANTNQRVINMLDTTGGDQVMLRVRVVELARSELKRFGIHWEGLINTGSFVFGLGQGRDFIGNTLTALGTANAYDRAAAGDNSLYTGFQNGGLNLNAAIDALENDGLISVLAEPNLTTRSGQAASFLAGGEVPIPVQGQNQQVTIEYRQFGVSLQFTPVVLSRDKISLTVLPEVSALSEANRVTTPGGLSAPSFTTRRASTTVDLGSGQTFAIAGLLRNDSSNNISKFPILGDVPVLGTLFRSTAFRNDQTELVILVTPFIVKPVDDPAKLKTPLDGYTPPNDFERIVLGKLSGETPKQPNSAKGEPNTPAAAFAGTEGEAGFLVR